MHPPICYIFKLKPASLVLVYIIFKILALLSNIVMKLFFFLLCNKIQKRQNGVPVGCCTTKMSSFMSYWILPIIIKSVYHYILNKNTITTSNNNTNNLIHVFRTTQRHARYWLATALCEILQYPAVSGEIQVSLFW